ncbi:MAG TPA: M15 family metallopeptidase [Chitinophagaceae bacterium]|nr:M15 family metallopeptidase [Chitinophagaceae bacterium]
MYDKIINRSNILRFSVLILSTSLAAACLSQQISQSKPDVTSKYRNYRKEVKKDPAKKMIELKTLIPNLVYDLRYASTNNFMHCLMYPENTQETFLRSPVANNLLLVQKKLNAKGLGLKIFDAYRPYSVTVKFWELVHDERYVANPAKGSGHNRGVAVDLTIVNLETGKELKMGTDFDNFTDSAHHTFTNLPEEVLQNRILLKSTMEKYGFKALDTEWWHYSLPDAEKFEVLDINF